jgi:hypothetical protein
VEKETVDVTLTVNEAKTLYSLVVNTNWSGKNLREAADLKDKLAALLPAKEPAK